MNAESAVEVCCDVGNRFSGHVQVTSDGHAAYRFAVRPGFKDASFAQLVKIYGTDGGGNEIVTRCARFAGSAIPTWTRFQSAA